MRICFAFACALAIASYLRAGTATGVSGLYYTAQQDNGSLQNSGWDSHWDVTYSSAGSTYTGSAHVVSSSVSGWVSNTSSAGWVTAPGALPSTTGTADTGGAFLPGDKNTSQTYLYVLKFTITGDATKGAFVTNQVSISLTIAADDAYKVYVNPWGQNLPNQAVSGTPVVDRTSAWTNQTSFTLSNGTNWGNGGNSQFWIGDNYLVVEVTNSHGNSGTGLNASGLIFYQTGSQFVTIDGTNYPVTQGSTKPIPEAGFMIPVFGALVLCSGMWRGRRRDKTASVCGKI